MFHRRHRAGVDWLAHHWHLRGDLRSNLFVWVVKLICILCVYIYIHDGDCIYILHTICLILTLAVTYNLYTVPRVKITRFRLNLVNYTSYHLLMF